MAILVMTVRFLCELAALAVLVWISAIVGLVLLGQHVAAAAFGIAAYATAIGARRFEPQVSNGDGSSRSHSA